MNHTSFILIRSLFVGMVIFFGSLVTKAQHINFEKGKWADVLAKAKAQNKPIFVDFYAEWCGPCKFMSKQVFTDATVAEYYNRNFISYKIDAEKEELDLVQRVGISAYPSLFYFSSNGEVLTKNVGALDAKGFKDFGASVVERIEALKRLPEVKQRYEANPQDLKATGDYLNLLVLGNKIEEAAPIAATYLSKIPDAELIENWQLIRHFATDTESREFNYVLENGKQFFDRYGEAYTGYVMGIMDKLMNEVIKSKDENKAKRLKKIYATFSRPLGGESHPQDYYDQWIDMIYYKGINDWNKYFSTLSSWMDKYQKNNWEELVKKSLEVVDTHKSKDELKKAEEWAQQAVKLNDAAITNYAYALVLNRLDRKKDAKKYAEAARKLNDDGELDSYITQLLEEIGDVK